MALNDAHHTSGDEPAIVHSNSGGVPHDAELAAAELLPCGRSLGRVWEQARGRARAADPHYSRCPQCREAIEGLIALERASRALRAEQQPDSHRLANRVINAVRAEVRLGRILLLDDPQGDLRIAESAAAIVLRRAADTVAGARVASCRLSPNPAAPTVHAVTITVSATLDRPLREVAAAVRRAVLFTAEHVLGLAVATVDVMVNAVLELPRALDADERVG
ncbi:hypothetical protein ACFXGI_37445 [Streptomyces sp. NPDC059355]|uniref:hypothetical protein n=1 Tax=Streptomyces sp. NPDC059355 TaxID=3346811 RepID=UPI0036B941FE